MKERRANNTLILYTQDPQYKDHETLLRDRVDIHVVFSLKSAIVFFLNHVGTRGFILDPFAAEEKNLRVLALLYKFNGQMPVYIIESPGFPDKQPYIACNPNVEWISLLDDVQIKSHPYDNKRKYYRTVWPLNTVFSDSFRFERSQTGRILSLSRGGAFIQTNHLEKIHPHAMTYLKIHFTDFSFAVEGRVVRIEKSESEEGWNGFAVEFDNITDVTKKFISRVINDKVIEQLFAEIKDAFEPPPAVAAGKPAMRLL